MTVDLATLLNRTAWDQQAAQLLPADRPATVGRLEWTRYPGHGPNA